VVTDCVDNSVVGGVDDISRVEEDSVVLVPVVTSSVEMVEYVEDSVVSGVDEISSIEEVSDELVPV
ncbi:unnamed protein product, partial [Protopolystoma xenopodis]